ncbi:MAG: methyltransferase domain-containing protein [Anaerolineales bacterium]|nr:methyltransferase domain-containing protein [Anaerolineales bacterium]
MKFICPRCRSDLRGISENELLCPVDRLSFRRVDGVWRFLLPERESHYARFIADYETIRRMEGRTSSDSSYYRALPFEDKSGNFSADWKIRALSYRLLEQIISPNSQIIDLGAGNSWLSNRLTLLDCQVHAVDLLLNEEDGLGTWKNYEAKFTPVQAEFSRLPFEDGSVSAVIFNASFHYSENYEETLAEALRTIRADGRIIVMDSPVYHNPDSGEKMVAERKANFLAQYGFASDSLRSKNYLTYDEMRELGQSLGIRWQHVKPSYGLRWRLRPWLAKIRGHREPAEFGVWLGARA